MTDHIKKRVQEYIQHANKVQELWDKRSIDKVKYSVGKYNIAFRAMNKCAEKISTEEAAPQIFEHLLNCEDLNVKRHAAVHCLKYDFHIERAEKILVDISLGEDLYAAFDAEMSLKVWRGEIPGKKL